VQQDAAGLSTPARPAPQLEGPRLAVDVEQLEQRREGELGELPLDAAILAGGPSARCTRVPSTRQKRLHEAGDGLRIGLARNDPALGVRLSGALGVPHEQDPDRRGARIRREDLGQALAADQRQVELCDDGLGRIGEGGLERSGAV
jgi:hypothetical protein